MKKENVFGSSLVDVNLFGSNDNHEASDYIADNYESLRTYCHIKTGEPKGTFEKTEDLLGDVCASIIEAEANGNGFDTKYSNEGDIISVENFVKGRIDLYAKNSKYQYGVKAMQQVKDNDGNVKFAVMCASYNDDDEAEDMNEFQSAMKNAHAVDEYEDVEAIMSIRENIEFCLDFDCGIDMLALLNNVDAASNIDGKSGFFNGLRNAFANHDELKDAFLSIMQVRKLSRPEFDKALAIVNDNYGYAI